MSGFYGGLPLNIDLVSYLALHLNINIADANVVRINQNATTHRDTKKRSLADE